MPHKVVYLDCYGWIAPITSRRIKEFLADKQNWLIGSLGQDSTDPKKPYNLLSKISQGDRKLYEKVIGFRQTHANNLIAQLIGGYGDSLWLFRHSIIDLVYGSKKEIHLESRVFSPQQIDSMESMFKKREALTDEMQRALFGLDVDKAISKLKEVNKAKDELSSFMDKVILDYIENDFGVLIGSDCNLGGESLYLCPSKTELDKLTDEQGMLRGIFYDYFRFNWVPGAPSNQTQNLAYNLVLRLDDNEINEAWEIVKKMYKGLRIINKEKKRLTDDLGKTVYGSQIQDSIIEIFTEKLEDKGVNVYKLMNHAPFEKEFYRDFLKIQG